MIRTLTARVEYVDVFADSSANIKAMTEHGHAVTLNIPVQLYREEDLPGDEDKGLLGTLKGDFDFPVGTTITITIEGD